MISGKRELYTELMARIGVLERMQENALQTIEQGTRELLDGVPPSVRAMTIEEFLVFCSQQKAQEGQIVQQQQQQQEEQQQMQQKEQPMSRRIPNAQGSEVSENALNAADENRNPSSAAAPANPSVCDPFPAFPDSQPEPKKSRRGRPPKRKPEAEANEEPPAGANAAVSEAGNAANDKATGESEATGTDSSAPRRSKRLRNGDDSAASANAADEAPRRFARASTRRSTRASQKAAASGEDAANAPTTPGRRRPRASLRLSRRITRTAADGSNARAERAGGGDNDEDEDTDLVAMRLGDGTVVELRLGLGGGADSGHPGAGGRADDEDDDDSMPPSPSSREALFAALGDEDKARVRARLLAMRRRIDALVGQV